MKQFTLYIILLLPLTFSAHAQQLTLYSQYNLNKFLINPAVAGVDGFTTIGITAREQWIGFKGTPRTHSVTYETKLSPTSYLARRTTMKNRRRGVSQLGNVALGAHLYNDFIGPIDRTGIEGTYAYHLDLENTLFSMGISLSFMQFRVNKDKLVLFDEDYDDIILGGKRAVYIPDANFGVFAMGRSYFAGLSVMNTLESVIQIGNNSTRNYTQKRLYYVMAGYIIEINKDIELQPSLLVKSDSRLQPQLDLQTKAIIGGNYWLGLGYRTGSALTVLAGINIERYSIGYAFDYNLNALMRYSYGSHELMATLKLGDNARRYKWLKSY